MSNNYISQINTPDLFQTLKSTENNLLYNRLNCVRVAIVDEFFKDNLTVRVNIANKQVRGVKADGSQVLAEYPPIYAKVHFFGWGDVGATYPIIKGMEGILLFNDREIESWFINGSINPLAYDRSHAITDALFICGLHSMPNMITFVIECLNLYYKDTYIRLGQRIDDENKTITNSINANVQDGNILIDEFIEKDEDDEDIKITNTININTDGSTIELKKINDIENETITNNIDVASDTINETFTTKNVNGDTIIIGDVTQTGNLIINGNLTVNGTIFCDDTITATTDVIGGGISLKNHTHTSTAVGTPTSPPIGA